MLRIPCPYLVDATQTGASVTAPRPRSPADALLPPVTNGLVGLYYPSSYSAASNQWSDLSGKGNHAITSGMISKAVATSLNVKEYLFGGTWETVKWPQVSCHRCCGRIHVALAAAGSVHIQSKHHPHPFRT
jgi:hypothetical protein